MIGLLVVFAGPSGVGKGTVLRHVLAAVPDAETSVSVTTRAARPGEVDGRHYHFVDPETFQRLVDDDAFLEHAVFAGHHYGTLRDAVAERLDAGAVVILEIEVQGAAQVAERAPEALRIFLAPPSMEELAARLARRGTETDAQAEQRLALATAEIAEAGHFHHVVVNRDPREAAREVVTLIRAARRRRAAGVGPDPACEHPDEAVADDADEAVADRPAGAGPADGA